MKGFILLLFKKDDYKIAKNYRGITLTSKLYNVML